MDFALIETTMIAIIGVVLAIATTIVGLEQYRLQGNQKKAEFFVEMRRKLKENRMFKNICDLIEKNDPKLQNIPFKEKRDFLGFFEEVALMMNSGLIQKKVAHYMFGYYAIRCWENENFWVDIKRDSMYWSLFRNFVHEMISIEESQDFKEGTHKYTKNLKF